MRSAAFTSQLRTSCKISKSIHLLPRRYSRGPGCWRGAISIGDIQAFFPYVGQVSDPLHVVPTL